MAKPKPDYGIDHFPVVNPVKTNGVYHWFVFSSEYMTRTDTWLFQNGQKATQRGTAFTAENAMDAAIEATDALIPQPQQ